MLRYNRETTASHQATNLVTNRFKGMDFAFSVYRNVALAPVSRGLAVLVEEHGIEPHLRTISPICALSAPTKYPAWNARLRRRESLCAFRSRIRSRSTDARHFAPPRFWVRQAGTVTLPAERIRAVNTTTLH